MHRSVCVSFSFSLLYSSSAEFHRLPAAIIVPCPRQSENEAKPELLCDPQEFVLTLFGVAQFLWYLLSDCQNSSDRAERCVTACRMICLTGVLKQHFPLFYIRNLDKTAVLRYDKYRNPNAPQPYFLSFGEIHISQAQVSRLEKGALAHIRDGLA